MSNKAIEQCPLAEVWDNVAEKEYEKTINVFEESIGEEIYNIIKKMGIKEKSNLLELGCGSGHLSAILCQKGYNVSLLDFSKKALEKAKETFNYYELKGEFFKSDLLEDIEIDKKFDLAWNSGVMEHFGDEMLGKAFSSVKKINAEKYIFIVPNPKSVPYLIFRYKLMKEGKWNYGTEYLREDYAEKLESEGFKVIEEAYIGGEFSIDQINLVYNDDRVGHYFRELIENDLIDPKEKYLKVYVAVKKDKYYSEKNNIINEIKCSKTGTTEFRTSYFDLVAYVNGLIENHQSDLQELKNYKENIEKNLYIVKESYNNVQVKHCDLQSMMKEKTIKIETLNKEVEELKELKSIKEAYENMNNRLFEERQYNLELNKQLEQFRIQNNILNCELFKIHNSDFWKFALKYYKLRDRTLIRHAHKSLHIIRRFGIKNFFSKFSNKLTRNSKQQIEQVALIVNRDKHEEQLRQILEKHKGKPIVIFPVLVDWNIPLFQRPQHIAINMAKEGYLYFFCTQNVQYDHVDGFEEIENGCYLTTRQDLLNNIEDNKIIHLYSTDMKPIDEYIAKSIQKGDKILYEYVDEIHEDISGNIPEYVMLRHESFKNNEDIIVVATADKLYNEVKKSRKKNCKLITNGVQYEHFSRKFTKEDMPEEIRNIVNKGKPIIGYFGALAKWFDYELIEKLAKERPEYEILLIGWNYDGSLNQYEFHKYENIHVVGPINYKKLPQYACWFDVSTITFRLNEITESTSPIKLFEYMALGKPIVTTAMPECRKYESVLIGEDHDDFVEKIDRALELKKDINYNNLLREEGLDNTWREKAKDIVEMLR